MKKSRLFALYGLLLGGGAPIGALLCRLLSSGAPLPPGAFVAREWTRYPFFYWYMLVGTSSVLTLVGFWLGKREDRIDYLKYRVAHPSTPEGRRMAHDLLKPQFQRHLELRKPISCLMLGLDFFEKISGTFGDAFKKTALEDFMRLSGSCLRPDDRMVAYSDEAFLCVLPDCDEKAARAAADRLRAGAAKLDSPMGQWPVRPTLGMGIVTVYDTPETNYRIMIDESGKNLYEARRRGPEGIVQTIFGKPST